jgi:hypothetical protein
MKKYIRITLAWLSMVMIVDAEYITLGGRRVWGGYADAKATILAVDADGLPVQGANVKARLFNSKYKDQYQRFVGETGSNGCFVVEGKAISELEWEIEKPGCYKSHGEYDFGEVGRAQKEEVVGGKWQPWNPTLTTVVKQIRSPIPMYAKRISARVPCINVPVGYDLEKGDWVAPFGQGQCSDFTVQVNGQCDENNYRHVQGQICFTNLGEGFSTHRISVDKVGHKIGSSFRWPYQAPTIGYTNVYEYEMKFTPDMAGRISPDDSESKNYILRTRVEFDEVSGGIKKASYSKIAGPITFDFTRDGKIEMYFTYYFNPTSNDRNLEFDPKKNLFENLGEFEQVYEP